MTPGKTDEGRRSDDLSDDHKAVPDRYPRLAKAVAQLWTARLPPWTGLSCCIHPSRPRPSRRALRQRHPNLLDQSFVTNFFFSLVLCQVCCCFVTQKEGRFGVGKNQLPDSNPVFFHAKSMLEDQFLGEKLKSGRFTA